MAGGLEWAVVDASAPGNDTDRVRWFRRHVAGSVAAVTVQAEGGYRASAVTAFMVTSLEPPLLLLSLEQHGQLAAWIESAGAFAVCLLTRKDQFLADQFAGLAPRASHTFDGIPHTVAATGSPILDRAIAWADCRLVDRFDTGDHCCLLGEILATGVGDGDPEEVLLYYRRRYRRLARL